MIWNRKDNNFPTFHHEQARIEALESQMAIVLDVLLYDCERDNGTLQFADALRKIIKAREPKK